MGYFYSEKQGAYKIKNKQSKDNGIIVSSCRFKNEIEATKKMKGIAVRLVRPALSVKSFLTTGEKNHVSETEQLSLPDTFFDYVLEVPEGKKAFQRAIDEFVKKAVPG